MTLALLIAVQVLVVGVLVVDCVRTNRVRRALGAGGEAPRRLARRRSSTSTDYAVIAQQSNSTRNQTSGFGL